MRSTIILFPILSALILMQLSGCSQFPPGIYRMDIMQGNEITDEMIAKLRVGMSKEQVSQVLGTPTLAHTLNSNRWDYYYSLIPGKRDKTIERHFTVFFQNGRVTHWTQDPI